MQPMHGNAKARSKYGIERLYARTQNLDYGSAHRPSDMGHLS
jgi:hypothetical protein